MYISYALGAGSGILLYWIMDAFTEISIFNQLWIILAYLIVVSPLLYKLSRIAWINIFIHFDKTGEFKKTGEAPLD